MDNEKIKQQLNQWKQKYYKSITDLEERQELDTSLRRSLSRLALVAQGIDSRLDAHLSSLRSSLRNKNQKQHELELLLEKIDETIIKMESKQNKSQTTGETLAKLLTSLNLSKPYKKEVKQLTKEFKSASNTDINLLLPQLISLLDGCLDDGAKSKKRVLVLAYSIVENKMKYKAI